MAEHQEWSSVFGKRIKELRKARGLSKAELASIAGVPRAYLWEFETGRNQPSFANAVALADALQVPLRDLVTEERAVNEVPSDLVRIPTFAMVRFDDETGVSGTGIVAYGAVFPSGKAVLAWTVEGKPQSVAIYDSIHDLFAIHVGPHGGKTQLRWITLPPELESWRGFGK